VESGLLPGRLELVAEAFVSAPTEGLLPVEPRAPDEFPVELFPHPASRSMAAKNGNIFFMAFVSFRIIHCFSSAFFSTASSISGAILGQVSCLP
jgi:hypothetical protein